MRNRIDFLISNPNHHWQMIRPIVRALRDRGHTRIRILSLCEFRRMDTPRRAILAEGVELKVLPGFRRAGLKSSSGQRALGGSNDRKRRAVQQLMWYAYLRPAWKRAFADGATAALLLLNDFAYPNNYLTRDLKRRGVPFYLLQEGIRFPLPNEAAAEAGGYGSMGGRQLFAWGENSRRHFRQVVTDDATQLVVSGSPRFDALLEEDFAPELERLRAKYGTADYILGLFSNPIDDQGFCSNAEKLALLENFLRSSLPAVREVGGKVWVKLHPREDPGVIESLIDRNGWSEEVQLVEGNIFAVLQTVSAAVVLASTVGLESLLMGKPLAVLELPGHGFVFNYVERGGGVGLSPASSDYQHQLAAFLRERELSPAARAYLDDSIGNLGRSAAFIAEALLHKN